MQSAIRYVSQAADVMDKQNPETLLLLDRGLLQMMQEKPDWNQALLNLNTVSSLNRNCVAALLGRACIEIAQGEISKALRTYCEIIENHPDVPASVRLGLGFCFFQLKDLSHAEKAFSRVLSLVREPFCVLVLFSCNFISTFPLLSVLTMVLCCL